MISTDDSFEYVVWENDDDTDSSKTTDQIPAGVLSPNTRYYWGVRHQDNHDAWSNWQPFPLTQWFTTEDNHAPNTPDLLSPPHLATGVSLMPTLQSSPFSDPDAGDTHQRSHWVISTDDSFEYVVWENDDDTDSSKTTDQIPAGVLSPNTRYYWGVRHQDNHDAWSNWQPFPLTQWFRTEELSEIHGRKWHDLDANGERDEAEPYLNGWTIKLLDDQGGLIDTATTMDVDLDGSGTFDAETETGRYSFTGLAPGTYTVAEVAQAGWEQTYPNWIEWVTVGDAENVADTEVMVQDGTTGYGSVAYEYRIGKYEVTNAQYCGFLNAVAADDPNDVYNENMADGFRNTGGITRSGSAGSYSYAVRPEYDNRPVSYLSWYDSLRFANWLHNGQPTGPQDASTTEDGAYDMSLGDDVVRKPGALVFLPSEDEWYKAAYYDPSLNEGAGGYWDYPTQNNTAPAAELPPGADLANGSANYRSPAFLDPTYSFTEVGAYTAKPSDSAYGTFDQAGNVWEWNEAAIGSDRGLRGGSFSSYLWDGYMHASSRHRDGPSSIPSGYYDIGLRVAGLSVGDNVRAVHTITLGSDQTVENIDFGNRQVNEVADITGRHIFYNNSTFDGEDLAANEKDDDAIALEKQALLPRQTATQANYTNYERGINGIMVDIAGLADSGNLSAADFSFQVGNGGGWEDAPDPLPITVREGAGVDGSDRVTIRWEDNAIEKQWLQVTVKATDNTGLLEDDICYFGNAPGDTGDNTINAIVNATDEIVARNFQHSAVDPALIDDPYDYNRDGLVNGTDQIIARENQTNPLTMLRLITAPDIALKQAAEPTILSADLDWLYEFEQMNSKNLRQKRSSVEQAVDRLLAVEAV